MEIEVKRAESLARYILTKYGHEKYSLFKLLSSIPLFQSSIETGDFYKKFYRNMLSFQKVVRGKYNVHWERKQSSVNKSEYSVFVHNGTSTRQFRDDQFGSVTGYIQQLAMRHFDDAKHFVCAPVIQVGHGINFDIVLDGFDSAQFGHAVIETLSADENYADLCAKYDEINVKYLGDKSDVINRANLIEITHQILLKMRSDDGIEDISFDIPLPLPFVKPSDYEKFMLGKMKMSYKSDSPIPEKFIENLMNLYGAGTVSGNNYIYNTEDPFALVGSTIMELPKTWAEMWTGNPQSKEVFFLAETGEVDEPIQSTSADFVAEGIVVTDQMIDAAKAYMATYWSKKIDAKISASDTVALKYGSREGEVIWNDQCSQGTRGKYFSKYPSAELSLNNWLCCGISALSIDVAAHDPVVLAKLVMARAKSNKQNVVWDQKRGVLQKK